MKYVSTRKMAQPETFESCLLKGLASDGGLYVPEKFPKFDSREDQLHGFHADMDLASFAAKMLEPLLAGSRLQTTLSDICRRALNFETPLRFLKDGTGLLELFHGPTAAFKDVGARFLAECLKALDIRATILVATSGDTGGAVAAAFDGKAGIQVAILYPKGKISSRQEKQLTSWGDSVRAFAVDGNFDECQRIVKEALADLEMQTKHSFISANSISIGRLLPQMSYHARAAVQYFAKTGKKPTLIIPTGNLGDAVAAMWAKRVGFPIHKIILATNSNQTLPDFFQTGQYQPGPTIPTLANAMDVSNPSNFERMMSLYVDIQFLKDDVASLAVSDDEISDAIWRGEADYGAVFCPHTAVAIVVKEKFQIENAIVVATAHPAKFESIVEPLIGHEIPLPKCLAEILERASRATEIKPTLEAFRLALLGQPLS